MESDGNNKNTGNCFNLKWKQKVCFRKINHKNITVALAILSRNTDGILEQLLETELSPMQLDFISIILRY